MRCEGLTCGAGCPSSYFESEDFIINSCEMVDICFFPLTLYLRGRNLKSDNRIAKTYFKTEKERDKIYNKIIKGLTAAGLKRRG